ncbi:MAG TPA: acylneuraminate cytidylyltransferase [Anaerolineales bacterium]|jgi:N-acylneuraminate cytidylyltransferase
MKTTEILAIIPARGGSKGIPRKNIRDFAGWPLIAWSIAAARQSDAVKRVIVSTDDEAIAGVARQFGAETPFLRPAEFGQDDSTDLPLFQHALKWLADNENYKPELVLQLRPTSPIRPRGLLDEAVQILRAHPEADSVRGVVPAGQNPYKMWRMSGKHGPLKPLLEVPGMAEPYNAPRQTLPPVYWQTGHIDAIRPAVILEGGSMTGGVIYPLVIDPRYTVDIDNLLDWARYEQLASSGGLDIVSPGRARRPMPEKVDMLIFDFDGVITDNIVYTDQDGREMVASSRSDGLMTRQLREAGVQALVLSSESSPVVAARAKKMGLEVISGVGIHAKGEKMREVLAERHIQAGNVVFVGNDVNDLPCLELAGWGVAVADAYPEVLRAADFILSKPGGRGAVRELCEMILKRS